MLASFPNCGSMDAMGNKDSHRREVKKPKKKAPKASAQRVVEQNSATVTKNISQK